MAPEVQQVVPETAGTSPLGASTLPPLLRPPALVKGDTIGVVAPSYAPKPGWPARGINALKRAGYGIVLDNELSTTRRFQRAEDERRAENFMGMWLDPKVKAVIGGTGGYGAVRMLPRSIDADAFVSLLTPDAGDIAVIP